MKDENNEWGKYCVPIKKEKHRKIKAIAAQNGISIKILTDIIIDFYFSQGASMPTPSSSRHHGQARR